MGTVKCDYYVQRQGTSCYKVFLKAVSALFSVCRENENENGEGHL